MRTISFFIWILLSGQASFASSTCTAGVYLQSEYLSGICTGNSCSGNLMGQSLNATGECSGGVSFRASGYLESEYVNGDCVSGNFSAHLPGSFLSWSGECSDGKPAQITSNYLPGTYLNGSCSENSSFSATVPGQYVSIQAQCP